MTHEKTSKLDVMVYLSLAFDIDSNPPTPAFAKAGAAPGTT